MANANHAKNATPGRDDRVAVQLWGELVTAAAAPLEQSRTARLALASELGLGTGELIGDPNTEARRLARELFVADLEQVVGCARRLANLISPSDAWQVFDAVATCTSYRGEPWVAADMAAEIAEQVATLASRDDPVGRVLHLRSGELDMRPVYLRRGDVRRSWPRGFFLNPYSHRVDVDSKLPADLDRELRAAIAERFAGYLQAANLDMGKVAADELDPETRAKWKRVLPRLLRELRRTGVVGLLPRDSPLDPQLIESLAAQYPLLFLAIWQDDAGSDLLARTDYQVLDPDIDEESAGAALIAYDGALQELSPGRARIAQGST